MQVPASNTNNVLLNGSFLPLKPGNQVMLDNNPLNNVN